jgi:Protein of unknown function (DUF2752)
MEEYLIPCMNKTLFGIECFGCGTQRAFLLVLKGNFIEAFKLFPAIYTTILFFLFALLHFIDTARNYRNLLVIFGILNALIMVISYFYKLIN